MLSVGWKLCIPTGGAAAVSSSATLQNQLVPTATPASVPVATPLIWLKPPTLDLESEEMHPLMVEYMRQQAYPGSDIVIEET